MASEDAAFDDAYEDWQLVGDAYYSRRLLYELAWGGGAGGGGALDLAFMRCARPARLPACAVQCMRAHTHGMIQERVVGSSAQPLAMHALPPSPPQQPTPLHSPLRPSPLLPQGLPRLGRWPHRRAA